MQKCKECRHGARALLGGYTLRGFGLHWLAHSAGNQSHSHRQGLRGACDESSGARGFGWLRQEENQYLSVPPDVAQTQPVPLQELICYAVHPPFLGWVDQKDPRSSVDDTGAGLLQPSESGKGS